MLGGSGSVQTAKDFTLDTTYAATAKADDVVRLNASQKVVLAATGDTDVLGVLVGFNFEGITATKPVVGKVMVEPDAVFEADVTGGTPLVGTAYGINGASTVDVADTAVPIVKVVEIVDGKPYVVITKRQLS
jgi:hypothetical protein